MVCEAVEQYAKQKAKEAAKEATIVDGIEYGATKEQIVARLVKKYEVNQEEAEKLYERYAIAEV